MNSIIRIMGVSNRTPALNPMAALEDILGLLAGQEEADIILLPRLSLCPPSCQALMPFKNVRDACEDAFSSLLYHSREMEGYLILTTPFFRGGAMYEAACVLHKGAYYELPVQPDIQEDLAVFQIGALRFCVLGGDPAALFEHTHQIIKAACDAVLIPCYEPVSAGSRARVSRALAAMSEATGCLMFAVNGGVGDTSSPKLYGGFITVAEDGAVVAHTDAGMQSTSLCYDADCDVTPLHPVPGPVPVWTRPAVSFKSGLLRSVSQMPYLPAESERAGFLEEVFELQCRSLAARLENTGMNRMVLGVSGGLDSTLALLCCAKVCQLLNLSPSHVLAVTMPGFGTSDRTYYNALQLMEQLGVSTRDISISGAVSSHFEDINHNPAQHDTTYENAQARERTQILFDLANELGAIVVGTGDLSEAALGFATFGGDHLAGYNVNICLNKTTIRALVRHLAETNALPGTGETLLDILDTPVSPELLPPGGDGETIQKSEEILGPYLLHDFFLYYMLRYHFAPQKIQCYAEIAFAGTFKPDFIREKLQLFMRRFFAAQFKRSCAPDSAIILHPCLSDFYVPSDMDAKIFSAALQQGTSSDSTQPAEN